MKFKEIKQAVKELGDGREFSADQYSSWIKRTRLSSVIKACEASFHGLYFLFREGIIKEGSVAGQGRYPLPNDFLTDLFVFYDGTLLGKVSPSLNLLAQQENKFFNVSPLGRWVIIYGQEFEIYPAPTESGKEIRLLYCGKPDEVSDDDYEDYFMRFYPDLHIYGMAEKAALYLGNPELANYYRQLYAEELATMIQDNRNHYLKNAKFRFQNWDEYLAVRHLVFPQYR